MNIDNEIYESARDSFQSSVWASIYDSASEKTRDTVWDSVWRFINNSGHSIRLNIASEIKEYEY